MWVIDILCAISGIRVSESPKSILCIYIKLDEILSQNHMELASTVIILTLSTFNWLRLILHFVVLSQTCWLYQKLFYERSIFSIFLSYICTIYYSCHDLAWFHIILLSTKDIIPLPSRRLEINSKYISTK